MLAVSLPVQADQKFYDRQNRYDGKAVTSGDTTRFYDRNNRYTGKGVVMGKVIRYYDRSNRFQGEIKR